MQKSFLVGASLCLAAYVTPAAAVSVDISGVAGSGQVTLTLSGTSVAFANGALSASTDNAFNSANDLEFNNFLADAALVDVIIDGTSANDSGSNFTFLSNTMTIGIQGTPSSVVAIDALFLDDDPFGPQLDDFGFRSDSLFSYSENDVLVFGGSAVLPLDITAFNTVTGLNAAGAAPGFILGTEISLTVSNSVVAVPVPAGLPVLGAGVAGLYLTRRRRTAANL